jgi:lipoprotein-releasing system ATP-binding protein
MSDVVLAAAGLWKSYGRGPGRIEVLRGLDLAVNAGEAVAVVGDSGVGKSTLLHVLGGLDRPDGGRLSHRGTDVLGLDARARAAFRNRSIGFVFQFHHLLPEFDALENVTMPLRVGRVREDPSGRARQILERLGLEGRLGHRPAALSGGEQQRVAIARALVAGPEIVLADEPTGNLDPATGRRVFTVLRELQVERSFSLVLATHNERLAAVCDRVVRLEDGRLVPLEGSARTRFFDGSRDGEPTSPVL